MVIPLFPSDVVIMDHECNNVFHHAVYGRQDIGDTTDIHSNGRVSLVLKRAMDQGNGRKAAMDERIAGMNESSKSSQGGVGYSGGLLSTKSRGVKEMQRSEERQCNGDNEHLRDRDPYYHNTEISTDTQ